MVRPELKAIVAMASNRVIGRDGDLPWRLPEDLKWFKKLTLGHPIVMGRRTMESIGRPLPKRRNIVLSRSLDEAPDGFEVIPRLEDLFGLVDGEEEVWVIGGAGVYRDAISLCGEVYLSYVFHPHEGDTRLEPFEEEFELEEVLYRDEDFEMRRYRNLGMSGQG